MIELHGSAGLVSVQGTLTLMNDHGAEVTRSVELGKYEATFVPWSSIRFMSQEAQRPR